MRAVFIPPAVEPDIPPNAITIMRTVHVNGAHSMKSQLVNPVVVITETTLKTALRKASSIPVELPWDSRLVVIMAVNTRMKMP